MAAFLWLILTLIDIYRWAVILYMVILMGVSFNILNPYQPLLRKILQALAQAVEPALTPIRKVIPPLGGIDISPLILLLALGFLERLIFSF